ncbi:hypothetical protein HanXRQr2_Chr02g0083211 [Helianthus annuus]|uniref:Uncharacterized protein n=1 Tax=Helianthus annuus TaxID=4232 RepID=A0A9K3JS20_HELAN|nr:hypothetical protein HanXRQr2_Chr02g0083211 [Helianthus annuus]KAJ0606028.1 hypothetical protein HanHA300_Chr02g0069561 [Helianthus annuus]KAJ0620035.1 hypothetical protein HanHA89_Chr02g0077931 [Helianthus annuus]KAJ0778494.1 hypothetical protein HanLR1_Chr02g0072311 [Helianthus annuus]KAJ0787460.1 hypothetical protein HanOQP8_Chr02g0082721 [Helianthus annuus]
MVNEWILVQSVLKKLLGYHIINVILLKGLIHISHLQWDIGSKALCFKIMLNWSFVKTYNLCHLVP